MEEIKKFLRYDRESGELFWIKSPNKRIRVGSSAGCLKSSGYIGVIFRGKFYLAHRIAWFLTHGCVPEFLDHVNGKRGDNRLKNLRPATKKQNSYNRKIGKNNKSGSKGVYWHKMCKKWAVGITFNGKSIHLGVFKNKKDAEKSYLNFVKKNHGSFASSGV